MTDSDRKSAGGSARCVITVRSPSAGNGEGPLAATAQPGDEPPDDCGVSGGIAEYAGPR